VPVGTLIRLPGMLTRQQAAYRATGGIHAAAVFDRGGRPLIVCEDIGRHNAVDKAVGYCLLRAIPLQDKLLLSTGRRLLPVAGHPAAGQAAAQHRPGEL